MLLVIVEEDGMDSVRGSGSRQCSNVSQRNAAFQFNNLFPDPDPVFSKYRHCSKNLEGCEITLYTIAPSPR